ITYLSDIGCLEIQGASLLNALVWLAINLVNRLRERLVSHRDQQ
ncbi:hypothetical protein ACEOBW_25765, partial [Escherichia coli]